MSLGEGTGTTMSDDEDELQMDFSLDQSGADAHDLMGFGPLLPTESERSLMERVRHELKIELKQVYNSTLSIRNRLHLFPYLCLLSSDSNKGHQFVFSFL